MRAPTIYKCSPLTNYQRVVTSSRLTLYHVMLLGHNNKSLYFKHLIKILTGFIFYCIIFSFVQQEYPGKTMEEGREEIPVAPMGVLAPMSVHARPFARPPIDTSRNFPAHVSAESISPNFPIFRSK